MATAPAATRPTVSRPELLPPPRWSRMPYFFWNVKSAWPGRKSVRSSSYSSGCASSFLTSSAIGVPVVFPSKTPERISTRSFSCRGETSGDVPGRRRSRNVWTSLSSSAMPGGQPSTTAPTAVPWLSPNVVIRKFVPKVFMGYTS